MSTTLKVIIYITEMPRDPYRESQEQKNWGDIPKVIKRSYWHDQDCIPQNFQSSVLSSQSYWHKVRLKPLDFPTRYRLFCFYSEMLIGYIS